MQNEEFIAIRRHLHQHPEVSEKEHNTSAYIQEKLAELWPEAQIELIDEKSIIASYSDVDDPIEHIGFRCELDALPIQEINDFDYRSKVEGVSHKCGHDGHMTILLRLAQLLHNNFPSEKRISLIFQTAEENGTGAKYVVEHSDFLKDHPLDFAFSLHNVPGYKLGAAVVKEGQFNPSVISVKMTFKGKTAHAAQPEKGDNPALLLAETLQEVDRHKNADRKDDKMLIITPVYAQLGSEAYGTSAGDAALGLTIRSWKFSEIEQFQDWLSSWLKEKAVEHHLEVEFEWFEEFHAIINDQDATHKMIKAAEAIATQVIKKEEPFDWGEDFGYFTENTPGMMFGLGAGEDAPSLHNPDYDFPDELIEIGSNLFYSIIKQFKH